ncbi:WD-40 repeat-containing protein [Flagelloscypha sp. PMI_526]|nr:WD-40 repeat-containing protein [Flagelloscypha sp. PMI_526]
MPSPPPPIHVLRTHSSAITSLSLSKCGSCVYSGDGSGLVSVTSLSTLRPIATWQAHSDSILRACEWLSPDGPRIITHARDNKLHIWASIHDSPRIGGASAALEASRAPELYYSMDVNALNYCPFALSSPLIALPNLVESSEVDIWHLPARDRIHAGIGTGNNQRGEAGATGIAMSLHLFPEDQDSKSLRLLAAYEFGGLILRQYNSGTKEKSVEGKGWDVVWSQKPHVDSVMAMSVSSCSTFALSVSADHLIVKYSILDGTATTFKTSHPGSACISTRHDSRVCAVGGWDGRVRLYSTKNFKELGTLKYHKETCQAILFVWSDLKEDNNEVGDSDSDEETERKKRKNWVLSGGKDGRVAVWALMDFGG